MWCGSGWKPSRTPSQLCLVIPLSMALGISVPVEVHSQADGADARIQTIDYSADQIVPINGVPGFQVMIELAPDEQIQSIAVGDSRAWQVTANRSGSLLFVKPIQNGGDTNMTVITNARVYAFDLSTQGGAFRPSPYKVRFRYPSFDSQNGAGADANAPIAALGYYRLRGAPALRPARMSDDGAKTYIDWAPETALPAVFIIDEHGREQLADGYMRGGLFVIDGVHQQLLFRIDRHKARAYRYIPKEGEQ